MNNYKYLLPISMLYMTIKIATIFMIYKIIAINGYPLSASTLIIPLWFLIGDIIAEIYGYKVARNLILMAISCQIVFAIICSMFVYFPSSDILPNKDLYDQLLIRFLRASFASSLAIALGGLFNAYAINKWKILLKGKYFLLRSLGASAISELVFTICSFIVEFIGLTSFSHIVSLIIASYLVKLIVNPILVIPIALITRFIKNHENIQVYDHQNSAKIFDTDPDILTISKITELYTESNGNSYFRDVIIPTTVKHLLGNYSEIIKVSGIMFRDFIPNSQFDWHTAPQEQYIVYLDGEVVVTSSGGETRIFKSGDILLAKDLTGKGHITKTLTYGRSLIIPLN